MTTTFESPEAITANLKAEAAQERAQYLQSHLASYRHAVLKKAQGEELTSKELAAFSAALHALQISEAAIVDDVRAVQMLAQNATFSDNLRTTSADLAATTEAAAKRVKAAKEELHNAEVALRSATWAQTNHVAQLREVNQVRGNAWRVYGASDDAVTRLSARSMSTSSFKSH